MIAGPRMNPCETTRFDVNTGSSNAASASTSSLAPGAAAALLCGAVYFAFGSDGSFHPRPSLYAHHTLTAQAWLHGRLYVTSAEIERQYMQNTLRRERRPVNANWSDAQLRAAYDRAMTEYFQGLGVRDAQLDAEIAGSLRRAYIDWVRIDDRHYAYWPPVTTLLFVPLVAIFGPGVSDVCVANVLGASCVFCIYWMLVSLRRHWSVLQPRTCLALALFYGLGTCHMYQACAGQVWLLSQLTATLFLTVSIALGLRWFGVGDACGDHANRRGSIPIMAAGVALALGFLSRNTIILAAPFFFVLIGIAGWRPAGRKTRFTANIMIFMAPLICAIAAQLAFNDLRFGSPLDLGEGHLADEGGNVLFAEEFKAFGRFNVHYLPRNVWYYFLNPVVREYPAYDPTQSGLTFDPMGNSLFLVSPPMLYLFLCGRPRRGSLLAAFLAGAVPGIGALMLYHATGWYQFGQRYFLDVMPFLILLVAFGMRGRVTVVSSLLILLSLATNAWGTHRFLLEQG